MVLKKVKSKMNFYILISIKDQKSLERMQF